MIRQPRGQGGFTLMEVLVALAMSGAVVLMVHQTFAHAIDGTARMDLARREHASAMQMWNRLSAAFGNLEVGTPGTTGFDGSPRQVSFSTVLGGESTARASGVRIGASRGWFVLRTSAGADSLAATDAVFDYLLSQGSESSWVRSWHSPTSAPLAVRLRVARDSLRVDTLLFVIGPRG
jgi:prepilin-type N-terminal cleavage/methylation domain-containing protein